jgi:hypothetical protein
MEVVREVFKHSSAHGARAAIRADQKSYGFVQLISSALDVHNILCRKNVPSLFSHMLIGVLLHLRFSITHTMALYLGSGTYILSFFFFCWYAK